MAKNLALSLRKWHQKNLIDENGGERKLNPSENPALNTSALQGVQIAKTVFLTQLTFDFSVFRSLIPEKTLLDMLELYTKDFISKIHIKRIAALKNIGYVSYLEEEVNRLKVNG